MMKKMLGQTTKMNLLKLTWIVVSFYSLEIASAQQQQQQTVCPLTRERKPWDDLTCSEQQEYLAAIRQLKQNGIYDEFVRVHMQNEAESHGTPEFLPWHRWFIWQFESALRTVSTNDPCMTLPYWPWEMDAGHETQSHIFDASAFGSFDGVNTRTGQCQWSLATAGGNTGGGGGRRGCLQRDMDTSFRFWSSTRLVGLMTQYRQYADDFPNNPNRNNGFRAALESGPHAAPHNMIGGNMVDPTSPNDPIFFLHHANVDRLWVMWQDYHGHASVTSYSVPTHYEGRRIDTRMPFHGNNDVWSFRVDNGSFPTPRQLLSNSGDILRVRYIQDRIIPNHRPNRRWFSSRPRTSNGCNNNNNRRRQQRHLAPLVSEQDENAKQGEMTMTQLDPSLQRHQHWHGGHDQILPNLRGGIRRKEPSFTTTTTKTDNILLLRDDDDHDHDDNDDASKYDEQINFSSFNSSLVCQNLNTFQSQNDRDQWNALCNDFLQQQVQLSNMFGTTTTTTMTTSSYGKLILSDMVANVTGIMALQECAAMGDPANAKEDWMVMMQLSNERAAVMDCFHIPDVLEE